MLIKSDLYWQVIPKPKSLQNPVSFLIICMEGKECLHRNRNAFRVSILTWMWSEIGATAFWMWIHYWSWTHFCRYSSDISAPQTAVFLAIMDNPPDPEHQVLLLSCCCRSSRTVSHLWSLLLCKASSKVVSFCGIHTWCKKHIGQPGKPDSAVRAGDGICIENHKSSRRKWRFYNLITQLKAFWLCWFWVTRKIFHYRTVIST